MAEEEAMTKTRRLPEVHEGVKTLSTFRRCFTGKHPVEGNVSGGGQCSSYIRGKMELECNGRVNDPGHLRDFDLEPYTRQDIISKEVLKAVRQHTEGESDACLYVFYFRRRNQPPQVVGWVLTTGCKGPEELRHNFIQYWPAKEEARYFSTIRWLAQQLGYEPYSHERKEAEGMDDGIEAQKAGEVFAANADETVLEALGSGSGKP